MTERLNSIPDADLRELLVQCSGSSAWADGVMKQRPFSDRVVLDRALDDAWSALDEAGWAEAWSAHAAAIPADTDAAACGAVEVALRLYRERFGRPFVSAAESRAADELLMRVRIRLANDEQLEDRLARDEQRRATRQRLIRMTGGAR